MYVRLKQLLLNIMKHEIFSGHKSVDNFIDVKSKVVLAIKAMM